MKDVTRFKYINPSIPCFILFIRIQVLEQMEMLITWRLVEFVKDVVKSSKDSGIFKQFLR